MDPRRTFNSRERRAIYLAANGCCEYCGVELEPGWHVDHEESHSTGGRTHVTNGKASCPSCNLKKGNRMSRPLRLWQQETLNQYRRAVNPNRFLIAAFPGMGKTEAAAAISRYVGRFVVVLVPQADCLSSWRTTLHGQGICSAARIDGDGSFSLTCASCNKPTGALVMTYAFAQTHQGFLNKIYRKKGSCLLICDEVHHLQDKSEWAKPIIDAQPFIDMVLALSATPFRTDDAPVPFVHTEGPWARELSMLPEHCIAEYGYGKALTMDPPPVTRAVFERYDADVTWLESSGEEEVQKSATLSEKMTKSVSRKARRHAIDPRGNWLPSVLARAEGQLESIRETDRRGAGVVICKDTDHAVATADELVRTSNAPVWVFTEKYSTTHHMIGHGRAQESGAREGSESGDILEKFKDGDAKWVVTVRKLSEGVDVPRLRVLVYATVTRTRLFFIQALGRVIRTLPLPEEVDQTAWVYIPDDDLMRGFAAEVENGIADAEIKAYEEEEERERAVDDTGHTSESNNGDKGDKFVSAEPEYSGATVSGHAHDPELVELARTIGGRAAETLATLRELKARGLLNIATATVQQSLFDVESTPLLIDPAAELVSSIKKKTAAARSWAGLGFRSGKYASYRDAITACNSELGELFDVWENNKDVTVDQVKKATKHAREQIVGLRRDGCR